MPSTLDKLHAILRRDLLTAVRHRSGFVVTLVGVFTELAAFYFLSRAIGPGFRPGGIEYFPFLMVGTGVYTFFVMSAQAFLSAVQEAQQTGTLEVLMTTSTAPAELVILSSISAFAGNLLNLLVYLFAGVAVFRAAIHANFFSCVAVLIFSLAIALALGIAADRDIGCIDPALVSARHQMRQSGNQDSIVTLARSVDKTRVSALDEQIGAPLRGTSRRHSRSLEINTPRQLRGIE